jgi:NAD(P)-dependent dehydrogenase (short-subunit alcohol dehydrogenase family)
MAMINEQLSLSGKTAIVTGSGRGLGRAMALAMAEAGADLVITARTPREIEATGKEVEKLGRRALVTPCDVTKAHDVEAMVAKAIEAFGAIDILINNAGGGRQKPVLEMTDEEWHWGIDINLSSTFLCSRAVGRNMVMRGRGKVINIASGWGYRGRRNSTAYCASKAAVINFTRAVAVEWSRYNIQVNCIAPGYFPLVAPQDAEDARQRAVRISRIPLGGGNPEDIGPLAVFLASDGADYLTGQTILLDGGALLP